MLGCWLVNSSLLLVPWLVPDPWVIAGAFVVIGATNMVGNVIAAGIRQRVVAPGALGRVGGAGRTLAFGSMAIGGPLGGFIAARWSMPVLFASMVALVLLVTLWAMLRISQDLVDEHELPEETAAAQ